MVGTLNVSWFVWVYTYGWRKPSSVGCVGGWIRRGMRRWKSKQTSSLKRSLLKIFWHLIPRLIQPSQQSAGDSFLRPLKYFLTSHSTSDPNLTTIRRQQFSLTIWIQTQTMNTTKNSDRITLKGVLYYYKYVRRVLQSIRDKIDNVTVWYNLQYFVYQTNIFKVWKMYTVYSKIVYKMRLKCIPAFHISS